MKLDGKTLQTLDFGTITVVLLDENPKQSGETLNVVGIDESQNIKWRVESPFSKYGIRNNIPFILITKENDGELIVTNFYGVRYKISSNNGTIISKEEVSK